MPTWPQGQDHTALVRPAAQLTELIREDITVLNENQDWEGAIGRSLVLLS